MIIPMARSTPTPDPTPGARKSIAVIRTYLRDQDPEIRQNAAAALAAIGDQGAIDVLIDMATDEDHPKVRDAVEKHLVQADGAAGTLRPLMHKKLAEAHGAQADGLHGLLGRLRLRGGLRDDPAAMQEVINMARAESSALRQRAEDTLADLADESEISDAVEELDKGLTHSESSVRSATYTLLGRLRMQGAPVAEAHRYAGRGGWLAPLGLPYWRRLALRRRTASAVNSDPRVAEAQRLSWMFVWAILSAAAYGGLVMATYLARILNPAAPEGFYPFLVLGITLIGVCAGVLATRRAVPIYLHFDRLAGGVIEVANAALWVAGPALVGVVLLLFVLEFSGNLRTWVTLVTAGTIAIVVFVAAVRAGTVVGFGGLIEPIYEVKDKAVNQSSAERERPQPWRPNATRVNQVIELLAGSAAGILAFGALVSLGRWGLSGAVGSPLARLVEGLWVFVMPTAIAVAVAFTFIDTPVPRASRAGDTARKHPVERRGLFPRRMRGADGPGWTRRVACALLVLTLPVILAAASTTSAQRVTDLARDGESAPVSMMLNSVPATFDFRAAFLQKVHIAIPDASMPGRATDAVLTITLFKWQAAGRTDDGLPVCEGRTDKRPMQRRNAPTRLETRLGWGCYSVEVGTPIGEIATGRSTHVASVLDTLTKAGAASGLYLLSVTLNADKQRRNTASASGNAGTVLPTVWFVDSLSARRTLTLTQPTCLTLSASPEGSVTPGFTKPASPRPASPYLLNVDLWRDSARVDLDPDDMNVTFGTVGAGTYDVRISRDDGKPMVSGFVAVNTTSKPVERRARSVTGTAFGGAAPAARRESPLSGYWNLETLPATYTFVVNFPQRIVASIPPSAIEPCGGINEEPVNFDFVLRLRRQAAGGLVLEREADDPEEINMVLQPGTYQLEVDGYRAGKVMLLPELSPSPVLELTLNAPPSKAARQKTN